MLENSLAVGLRSANFGEFGRLGTVFTAGSLTAKYSYDGFNHIASERKKVGASFTTTNYVYDPFDRTQQQTANAGGANEKITRFNYLALSTALATEEDATGKVTKSYQYSPWGQRLSQVVYKSDGTKEPTYYSYNGHSDVEAVTDSAGDTKSTYGYTLDQFGHHCRPRHPRQPRSRRAAPAPASHDPAERSTARPLTIGENMARVQVYAEKVGGHAYRPWTNAPSTSISPCGVTHG